MNPSGAIYISSNDRNPNYDYNNVTYQLPNIQYLTSVALISFDFIYGINNININNNIAYFQTSTQSFQVTLVTGDYDYVTLAAQVLVQLNALGLGAFTLTYANGLYTLTAPQPISFLTNPPNPLNPPGIAGKRDWVDMLGFLKNTPLQSVFISGVPNIAYTDVIYILCDELHRRQTVRDTSSNGKVSSILGVVYVNKNEHMDAADVNNNIVQPKHITDRIKVPKYTYMDLTYRINTVSIRLVDQQGNDLPPTTAGNGSCQYTLEIICANQDIFGA